MVAMLEDGCSTLATDMPGAVHLMMRSCVVMARKEPELISRRALAA